MVRRLPAARLAAGRLQTQALLSFAVAAAALAPGASGGVGGVEAWAAHLTTTQLGLLCFSALAPGVAATLLQAQGQKVVPAPLAQPIYALLPIFAVASRVVLPRRASRVKPQVTWALLLLHEPVTAADAVGGCGLAAAAVLASTEKAQAE